MSDTPQGQLFDNDAVALAPVPHSGLFAEVVFDLPLDHAFSYAVPENLRDQVAVGKRVLAPFGRGDRATTGFCVHVSKTAPDREVKALLRVVDDEPLLDDGLLRLTRWMADYYLCGWGQVLNVVIPAGARAQAGTRAAAFLKAVPENEWPIPLPKLTPKQAAAFAELRDHGKPMEMRRLAQLVHSGLGPLEFLVKKGVAKRVVHRVDQFAALLAVGPDAPEAAAPVLNADQDAVWQQLQPVLQQGGFHPLLLYGVTGSGKTELYLRAIEEVVRQGKEAHCPGARDQPDAADDPVLPRPLRRAWLCCTATWATPSAVAIGGASRPARCRSSSGPAAPFSRRPASWA